MTNDTKMLQLLLDGQASIKKELREGFKSVDERFDKVDKRIDKLGLQIASLEDDAPTIDEFDELKEKVVKIQKNLALG
jgi:chromosome segregation ATPase